MENFWFTFNVIAPMVIMMAIGYAGRRTHIITQEMLSALSKLNFRVNFPIMLYVSVSTADIASAFNGRLITYACGSTAMVMLLATVGYRIVVKEKRKLCVMIQSSFRCSFLIFSLHIAEKIYGPEGGQVAAMLAGFMVPLQVALSIVALTVFNDPPEGEKGKRSNLWKSIVSNPLIVGVVVGLAVNWLRIPIPEVLASALSSIKACATPLGLVALGAEFQFSSLSKNVRYIAAGTIVRLVVIPFFVIGGAILMGFRGVELITMMTVAAAPTAMASYIMASEMGADGELAGQLVVSTTFFSIFTMFTILLALRSYGML